MSHRRFGQLFLPPSCPSPAQINMLNWAQCHSKCPTHLLMVHKLFAALGSPAPTPSSPANPILARWRSSLSNMGVNLYQRYLFHMMVLIFVPTSIANPTGESWHLELFFSSGWKRNSLFTQGHLMWRSKPSWSGSSCAQYNIPLCIVSKWDHQRTLRAQQLFLAGAQYGHYRFKCFRCSTTPYCTAHLWYA